MKYIYILADIVRMYFMVGGDFNDLEYVDYVTNVGYPVIIMAGTRGAADILTNVIQDNMDLQ